MIVNVFFAICDAEIETCNFFTNEDAAHVGKLAWLRTFALANGLDADSMDEDELENAAMEEGYDCYVRSGKI